MKFCIPKIVIQGGRRFPLAPHPDLKTKTCACVEIQQLRSARFPERSSGKYRATVGRTLELERFGGGRRLEQTRCRMKVGYRAGREAGSQTTRDGEGIA